MEKWRQRLKSPNVRCALWVALCFALTSAVYLSWLHRLVALAGAAAADWLSMGAGYLLQAAGMGLAALRLRRSPNEDFAQRFTPVSLLFAGVSAPALLTPSPTAAILFGMLMNLLCGVISGYYLYAIARRADPGRLGLVFGGGYAIASVVVGLPALIGRGDWLHSGYVLLAYMPLAVLAAWTARGLGLPGADEKAVDPPRPPEPIEGRDLALACGVVVLISLVKNLGFGFPSADIEAGLSPELSRIAYAVGLAAAGWINDKSRRNGLLCTIAALILPFIMLGLAGEPVPSAICWGLDYLFFGFFSVFRAVLLLDIAVQTRRWELAPLGLLAGRLGDVAGTALALLLAAHRLALIGVTALLFFPTVFLCFRLYRRRYEPEQVRQRSEQEVFEAFCLHNDISAREREVLRLVIAGQSNGEIAEALFITESTVKYHVRNILQKTGCKNRMELQRKFTTALYPHLSDAPALTLLPKEDTGS